MYVAWRMDVKIFYLKEIRVNLMILLQNAINRYDTGHGSILITHSQQPATHHSTAHFK